MTDSPAALRLLYLNPHRDPSLNDPDALLDRYASMRLWCGALAAQGHAITVWQAFPRRAERTRDGVRYRFLPYPRRPDRAWPPLIREAGPGVVHIDGLIAPVRLFRLLEACLRAGAPAVVQDHGGGSRPGPSWKAAAALVRARPAGLMFSAAAMAEPWTAPGVFGRGPLVLEVMESSTRFTPEDRRTARERTGLDGEPLLASVGRLNRGKDPLALLRGFTAFAAQRPGARLAMVYREAPLLERVERFVARTAALEGRVTLLGALPAEGVRLVLSAADIFVSASRREGSGYAALEAMACGAVPVLSDIPPFRAMTGGEAGALFPPGDASALADRLAETAGGDMGAASARTLDRFRRELGVEALGRKAAAAYARVVSRTGREAVTGSG